ncbi:hypothetical protein [Pelagimonas varians]|uniref:YARHG domain-containing protein n=1 Tax=Pelagimonas varians TaxID=696760 RepID=A0A238KCI4_9RHOB|nr:hypothetical protein [Pelagimonas varians]PYG29998.1 hypothetical protein C8N36_107165 [Pelagimonas varians]SMX40535.1 hypothetical protein PEV8663_02031 [Pelagimonas varians]
MKRLKTAILAAGLTLAAGACAAEQQCWVGAKYDDHSQWNIACSQTYGSGSQILSTKGYANILFGPATWDQCKAWADKNMAQG